MGPLSNAMADRAESVRELLAESEAAHRTSVDGALAAGNQLVTAKAECRHGEWLPFLERAGIHDRQARRLMQLARSGLKVDSVSTLGGIRASLDFLAKREAASRALLAAIDGENVLLPQLRHALALIDDVANCFPEEERGPALGCLDAADRERVLRLIEQKKIVVLPEEHRDDLEVIEGLLHKVAAVPLPEVGRALIVFHGDAGHLFSASYVLPASEPPGHYYVVTLSEDSAALTPRPLHGATMRSGPGSFFNSVWTWIEHQTGAPPGQWTTEECPARLAEVAFSALDLTWFHERLVADNRPADAAGVRALMKQIAGTISTTAA